MTLTVLEMADPAECFALRHEVFVTEQGFSETEEFDALDAVARHLLMRDDGEPVATARLSVEGTTARVGRICVARAHRRRGLGAKLVAEALTRLGTNDSLTRVVLGAQVHAIGFYENLGFSICGPVYDDGGVPHREMERFL